MSQSPAKTGAIAYSTELAGGKHWSLVLRPNTALRLTDISGGASVGMLFYNPRDLLERYNAPDTLKCQHIFKLTRGACLYSDMGRIFCSVTHDSVGWHDTVTGTSTHNHVEAKWGARDYQRDRNDWKQNGHDAFLTELAKYGLGKRDLAMNVNWFTKVAVGDDGTLNFAAGNSKTGDHVELRFEMETLVVLHTCPHPLDPAKDYPRRAVRIDLKEVAPAADDDVCRLSRPENGRGFENNRLYHLGCGCGQ